MHGARNESTIATRKTRRLVLRPPRKTNLDFVVALFALPELVVHRPYPEPDSREVSAARLKRSMAHWSYHGFGRWAIEHEGQLIGFGGLTVKEGFEGLNISFHLHPGFWGQGYATELVDEALSVAFGLLGAEKVIGLVRPANPASRHVLERTGFVPEGEVLLEGAPTLLFARYP